METTTREVPEAVLRQLRDGLVEWALEAEGDYHGRSYEAEIYDGNDIYAFTIDAEPYVEWTDNDPMPGDVEVTDPCIYSVEGTFYDWERDEETPVDGMAVKRRLERYWRK